jgi:phospholipid/cholesterol/gamma-HCH transport system permease protein
VNRQPEPPRLQFVLSAAEGLILQLAGSWRLEAAIPAAEAVDDRLEVSPGIRRLIFDTRALAGWDSGLLIFLRQVVDACARRDVSVNQEGLPPGVRRMLALATAVPENRHIPSEGTGEPFLQWVGSRAGAWGRSSVEMLAFLGELTLAFWGLVRGRARFRRSDLILIIQECGAQALPVVSLISVLVGLILAFIGSVQLSLFGAQIFVADLVGIGMVRVMGAVMAGVIMAGRTGAAFAAQIGTMQVNEEIDALKTLGISPVEFLVLPRVLALALMMPLLCLYADFLGIVGGLIVGVTMLDLNMLAYMHQTGAAVALNHFWVGLAHSCVFGVLVALAGCLRGLQCQRSASAVGQAATSAVVTGIVSIVVASAVITVICDILGV